MNLLETVKHIREFESWSVATRVRHMRDSHYLLDSHATGKPTDHENDHIATPAEFSHIGEEISRSIE